MTQWPFWFIFEFDLQAFLICLLNWMFGVNFVWSSENCKPAELEKEHCLPLFKNTLMAIIGDVKKKKKNLACCLHVLHSGLLFLFSFILLIFCCVLCDLLPFCLGFFLLCLSMPCYFPFSAPLLPTIRLLGDHHCKSENYFFFILENFSS